MEILEDKLVHWRTRDPAKYGALPRQAVVAQPALGCYEMVAPWDLDTVRILRNMGIKGVPSPILRKYNWPGRFKPMDHQRETASFLTLNHRAYVFNSPGTGKTSACLWAADYLMRRGYVKRVLVVCPLSIMDAAWLRECQQTVIHRRAAIAHSSDAEKRAAVFKNPMYEIVIINYDGLKPVTKLVNLCGFDLVIVDECFVAGTPIETPTGPKPIESLRVGDEILTSGGVSHISETSKKRAHRLVTLRLSDGREVTCTPEHPFFTDAGWIVAENCRGRRLVLADELSNVRKAFSAQEMGLGLSAQIGYANGADLQQILRAEAVSLVEPGGELFFAHEAGRTRKESRGADARRAEAASFGGDEGAWACAESAGGKRYRDDGLREIDSAYASGICLELCSPVGAEAAQLSDKLQARLRRSETENRAGGGWTLASDARAKAAGCKERGEARGVWVEAVSYHERRNSEFVYNLGVAGAPHYFAAGCLVHNCQAAKHHTTLRWKTLRAVTSSGQRLWMLTGTPAAQSPLDAFGLAKLKEPGMPLTFATWRDRTMRKVTQFKWMQRQDAPTLVHDLLQPAIRYTKEQCLDLPPVMTETRECAMTPQQKKYYDLMRNEMVMKAAGETVTAPHAAVLLTKLLQVSAGSVRTDTGEVLDFDCTPRLALLDEVMEEAEGKVLIFAPYRASGELIMRHLDGTKIACAEIHGGVSATDRNKIFQDFQQKPDPRVLVIQPQAASHGVTLTAADTVVFWGPVMSVETYLQCISRSDRIGQVGDHVTVVHLQCSPIEKKMFKQLSERVDAHLDVVKLYEEEIHT